MFHFIVPVYRRFTDLKIFFINSHFQVAISTQNHPHLNFPLPSKKNPQTKTKSELCGELCSDNTDRFNTGNYSYPKNDLRSPRRDTASFCGFCVSLKSTTNICLECDVE